MLISPSVGAVYGIYRRLVSRSAFALADIPFPREKMQDHSPRGQTSGKWHVTLSGMSESVLRLFPTYFQYGECTRPVSSYRGTVATNYLQIAYKECYKLRLSKFNVNCCL
jgi:hypothetical protein